MVNVLVKHCGPWFFSAPLPGSTLLILDSIHAAGTIISSSDSEVSASQTHLCVTYFGHLYSFSTGIIASSDFITFHTRDA